MHGRLRVHYKWPILGVALRAASKGVSTEETQAATVAAKPVSAQMQATLQAVHLAALDELDVTIDTICGDIQGLHDKGRLTYDDKTRISNLLLQLS
eukprot:COSAG02_NODE_155_length_33066_cov_32.167562_21_plen_96_part_00